MRNTETYGLHFFLRTGRGKVGQAAIYAKITVNGKSSEVSLKKQISPADWIPKAGRAKPRTIALKQLNMWLDEQRGNIHGHYDDLKKHKKVVSSEMLKLAYLGITGKEETLLNLFKFHNDEMKSELSEGTLKNYRTTQSYVTAFLKEKFKREDIFLVELNYAFIKLFHVFLQNFKPPRDYKMLHNNGIMKHLERLRKIGKLAHKMEFVERHPFELFELNLHEFDRGFLDDVELYRLENTSLKVLFFDF
ncbi:phage integrase SAM-like domain-containing protein [Chitinophaga pendula]|uniref:phage integrase SAM-like domain and Arm DNA-binding domain-containing protein n=1 Tax=Chitinophaga TaxID=79328 RepID=UPI0012FE44E0|nr:MULTISPECIES: phage integrase SAM-like domain and Arm DNA-binding domain-containing protein [Chitinophaga]UCJ04879.1 phage integrase SAM-like domain-containing protein [Chitinophaga pendula]